MNFAELFHRGPRKALVVTIGALSLSLLGGAMPAVATCARQEAASGDVVLSSGEGGKGAVVYLEGKVRSVPPAHAVVDQRDRRFIRHISTVTVGTKVDFPNHDVVFHNVFAEYHSERFDLGMYPRGATKTQVFDPPGLAVLLCSIHPFMSAYVMCVDTPYYAIADAHGRFPSPKCRTGSTPRTSGRRAGKALSARCGSAEHANSIFELAGK